MLILLAVLSLFQVSLCQNFQDVNLSEGQLTVVLEDNLGSGDGHATTAEWTERTVITIKSLKPGPESVNIAHTRPWTDQLTQRLQELSKSKGFYKLRLHHRNNKQQPNYVQTFTDACFLRTGAMAETISLLIDATPSMGGPSHTLIGGSILTPSVPYCDGADGGGSLLGYNSTVVVRLPAAGTTPDTASYIEKLESIHKEKLENKDNRSFFVKYWMYIVPFVVLLILSNGGGGGGQDGGR